MGKTWNMKWTYKNIFHRKRQLRLKLRDYVKPHFSLHIPTLDDAYKSRLENVAVSEVLYIIQVYIYIFKIHLW